MYKKVMDADTGDEFSLHYSQALLKDLQTYHDAGCKHDRVEIRRSTMRDGRKEIRKQCLECGELIGSAISRKDAPQELSNVDLKLRDEYQNARKSEMDGIIQKHVRLQREQNASFDEKYAQYRETLQWKEKRRKVLSRAGGLCEGCREKPADVVHHLTYEHVFDELLFELVALCKDCHAKCHPEHSETKDSDEYESPCCGCRWGGYYENDVEWCSILDIPAAKARADKKLCAEASEPLK